MWPTWTKLNAQHWCCPPLPQILGQMWRVISHPFGLWLSGDFNFDQMLIQQFETLSHCSKRRRTFRIYKEHGNSRHCCNWALHTWCQPQFISLATILLVKPYREPGGSKQTLSWPDINSLWHSAPIGCTSLLHTITFIISFHGSFCSSLLSSFCPWVLSTSLFMPRIYVTVDSVKSLWLWSAGGQTNPFQEHRGKHAHLNLLHGQYFLCADAKVLWIWNCTLLTSNLKWDYEVEAQRFQS